MTSNVCKIMFAIVAGIFAIFVDSNGSSEKSLCNAQVINQVIINSVGRYATEDFAVACLVRPRNLIEHTYFGSIPIDSYIPEGLSLGRLEEMEVEELAVFCGPAIVPVTDDGPDPNVEWAAVARTSRPIQFEAFLKRWRQSQIPQVERTDAKTVAIQIGKHKCFQVPAGTFIPPVRHYVKLKFTDRDGQPTESGINVGNVFEDRKYLEGATKSSATFTLDNLDESDLVDGQLQLELRLDVFLTQNPDSEYTTAEIELRNPDTGLRSEPISFAAKSSLENHLEIPRELTAVDGNGKRQVELLEDLVANGRLEIILKATSPGNYLGVGNYDLRVRTQAFEYAFVSDQEIVVATSPQTLEKMLKASSSSNSLSHRLSQSNDDIVLIATARDDEKRNALQLLKRSMWKSPGVELAAESMIDVSASVNVSDSTVAHVRAEYRDRQSTARAMRILNQMISTTKLQAQTELGAALDRADTYGSLLSMAMDGVSMRFPELDSSLSADRKSELLSMIEESLESILVESNNNVLTIEFAQPESLSQLTETAQIALANMEEILARELFQKERFDLGVEMFQRATNRFPHVPQIWFRRAHHLSFNMSKEFGGYDNRYTWVRDGIDVLLDGAGKNPDTIDFTWMTARFIARKIGWTDDRAMYRPLFSEDKHLLTRIAKLIDLEKTSSPDQKVDSWLVAKALFEHCIIGYEKMGASSSIPPLLLYSRPAATQARYAQNLSELGYWNESQVAWKEAERLHEELGEKTIELENSERVRLSDLNARLSEFGPDDPTVKKLKLARYRILYDHWLLLCKYEQIDQVQSVRRLAHQAAERERMSEPRAALNLYHQSLQTLSELHELAPEQISLLAGEFQSIAKGYRKIVTTLDESVDAESVLILELIENTSPISTSLLAPRPEDDGILFRD